VKRRHPRLRHPEMMKRSVRRRLNTTGDHRRHVSTLD
jgi:hypothetical protein